MKKVYLLILSIMLTATLEAAERYRYFLPPSAFSASYSTGSFSSLVNPVFTQRDAYPFLAYSFVKESDAELNHFASVNLLDFDFIYSGYNGILQGGINGEETSVSLYTINRGFMLNNIIGLGLGYSFTASDEREFDGCSGWHAGFLLRPVWFISAGAVFREIEDKTLEDKKFRSETYSLAIRPFTDRITLTADTTRYSSESGLDNITSFGAELTGWKGISLHIKGDTDKNYTFGLSMPFSFRGNGPVLMTVDGYGGANDSIPDFYSGGVSFTAAREKNSFKGTIAGRTLYLRLQGNYDAENAPYTLFSRRERSFHHLLAGVRMAASDKCISSLILDIDSVSLGLAQMQELREEIGRFRKNGKQVYALLNYTGNKEYYLASSADKIYFTPNSTFAITGLKMQVYFIKGLMDRAGVKYESVSKGKYKSFNETFTRTGMSPDAKDNMQEILSDLNNQFISGISEGRNIPAEKINELFAAGFYLPETAKDKGFIDAIMHRENAVAELTENSKMIKFEEYIEEHERFREWGPIPEIAVVHVTGSIISGKGGDSSYSSTTGDYDYREALEKAFTSSSVKAVVVRVDSGGGSAAASDYMWNYLLLMKKKHPKPVVFSFGNIAASGGYYIACTGDKIFASRGTITGSIGVVAGKLSLKELYSKLGITSETIKMSEFADVFSETRDLTEKEKKLFQENIDFIYDRFTGRVIEGRKIDSSKIPEIAEGKVHTGRGAAENGLADENSGLMGAIEFAVKESGIDDYYTVVHLPEKGGYIRSLMRSSAESTSLKSLGILLKAAEKYNFPDEKVLYMTPYVIEIE
ncbi:MAG TPA: signal peptide peptidase SppA [Spirochaetota bacterium]|nr:signal peptide peptidase SppA [Spirochaetota bacterium]